MTPNPTLAGLVLCGVAGLAVSGCGQQTQDLHAYVAHIKARQSSDIAPVPQIRTFAPFKYRDAGKRDPFEPAKGERETVTHVSSGIHPDTSRPKQPLEEFPLGSLHMLGTLHANNRIYALILTPDGIVHRTATGEHAGENYGKIVNITSTQVALREIVPDGFGGYQKRPAAIQMQDKK